MIRRALLLCAALLACVPALAAPVAPVAGESRASTPGRTGTEIQRRFREGLADPGCGDAGTPRWKAHFAHAPGRMAARDDDLLPLFGYVVDAVREAGLPTEYALIPFVESGYRPGARSSAGPAGLWQMIAITARNQKVPMRGGYDGRLSAVDSTRGALRYLRSLHYMFGGDWRLAVMAYNAGEYRILGALRRAGRTIRDARPESLPGVPAITQSYVRKIQSLSCLLQAADDRPAWNAAIDRPVPYLRAQPLPAGQTLQSFAARHGHDAAQLRRLNPALAAAPAAGMAVLAPGPAPATTDEDVAPPVEPMGPLADASAPMPDTPASSTTSTPPAGGATTATGTPSGPAAATTAGAREHVVARGDNPSTIARRHGLKLADLLAYNGLHPGSVLRPGQVLRLDAPTAR